MNGFFVSLVAFFASAAPAVAQSSAPIYEMRLDDGVLAGPGADLLFGEVPGAQFILVGEDHGFADPPAIALALAKAARPHGLVHHVAEIGPLTDEWVEGLLEDGGPDNLRAALEGRPLAVPFLGMREDAELAAFFLEGSFRGRDVLWGVDQEFIGSTLIWLERLEALARTDAAKSLAFDALAAERAAFASGDFGAMFMFTATPEKFKAMRSAFANVQSATPIIDALDESAAIYRAYNEGKNYASNADRVAYIRREFLRQYETAKGPAPRALLKMGAIHLGLGTTFLSTFDLGALTEGIAAENGLEVLRVLVAPLAGEQTTIAPSADGAFRTSTMKSEMVAGILNAIGVQETAIPSASYAVIPLEAARRALEQKGIGALNDEQRFFVLGYDYLVTTRGARAATPLSLK